MLSDSLFQAHFQLCRDIYHYGKDDKDYPNAQRANMIKALCYLDMARYGYDHFGPDDKKYNSQEVKEFKANAVKYYEQALLGRYGDSPIDE